MGDKENADRENQQRQRNAHSPLPAAIAQSAPNPNQPHREHVHDGTDTDPAEPERWFRNPDWHMVLLTSLIFAVGIFTAWIFYCQFCEMSNQTRLLKEQTKYAARESVEAAMRVEKQLTLSREQVTAAQDNVKTLRRNFELGNRAYIVPKKVRITATEPRPGGNVKVVDEPSFKDSGSHTPYLEVTCTNAGHTPATHALMRTIIDLVTDLPSDHPNYHLGQPDITPTQSIAVVAPDGMAIAGYIRPLSPEEFAAVEHGQKTLVIYGYVNYTDIFKHKRHTKFCFAYEWQTGTMPTCPHHNQID